MLVRHAPSLQSLSATTLVLSLAASVIGCGADQPVCEAGPYFDRLPVPLETRGRVNRVFTDKSEDDVIDCYRPTTGELAPE